MTVPPERLSRLVSHALRHEPWLYELELDDEGWVPVAALLDSIHREGPSWAVVDRAALANMIEASSKCRHELKGDRIRALYGHSVPGRLAKEEAIPPDTLFHGTSPSAWKPIQRSGLLPMNRQYVHLSVDVPTAVQVARRKSASPVILVVRALSAYEAGARFYVGNELVWLADCVPPSFISEA